MQPNPKNPNKLMTALEINYGRYKGKVLVFVTPPNGKPMASLRGRYLANSLRQIADAMDNLKHVEE